MHLEEIRTLCLALPAVTEDIKWENHLCFNVGDKMFLITAPDEVPVTASIKVSEDDFRELITKEGIDPAPYLARYHWVRLRDLNCFTPAEWRRYVAQAHELVAARLTRSVRKRLKLE